MARKPGETTADVRARKESNANTQKYQDMGFTKQPAPKPAPKPPAVQAKEKAQAHTSSPSPSPSPSPQSSGGRPCSNTAAER